MRLHRASCSRPLSRTTYRQQRSLPRRCSYSKSTDTDQPRLPTDARINLYFQGVKAALGRTLSEMWSGKHWTKSANPVEWVCHSFDKPEELEKWTEYSDRDVGGKTRARLLYDPLGRAVFEGHLNIEVPKGSRLVRSGYAAVMAPDAEYDFESFNALEIFAKGDGRMYVVNLRPDLIGMPHLMWQCPIRTTPEWKRYVLPLNEFMFVVRGYENERAGEVFPERVKSIGFLMAERRNGPFRLEVEYIKAINTELMGRGKFARGRIYKKSYLRNMEEEEGLFDVAEPAKFKKEK